MKFHTCRVLLSSHMVTIYLIVICMEHKIVDFLFKIMNKTLCILTLHSRVYPLKAGWYLLVHMLILSLLLSSLHVKSQLTYKNAGCCSGEPQLNSSLPVMSYSDFSITSAVYVR